MTDTTITDVAADYRSDRYRSEIAQGIILARHASADNTFSIRTVRPFLPAWCVHSPRLGSILEAIRAAGITRWSDGYDTNGDKANRNGSKIVHRYEVTPGGGLSALYYIASTGMMPDKPKRRPARPTATD